MTRSRYQKFSDFLERLMILGIGFIFTGLLYLALKFLESIRPPSAIDFWLLLVVAGAIMGILGFGLGEVTNYFYYRFINWKARVIEESRRKG